MLESDEEFDRDWEEGRAQRAAEIAAYQAMKARSDMAMYALFFIGVVIGFLGL